MGLLCCTAVPGSHHPRRLRRTYRDVTGTGKTATFAVSILQKIDASAAECQALVLAPTRELAQQIVKVVRALGDFMQLQVGAALGLRVCFGVSCSR